MTAKQRNLDRNFDQVYETRFRNLLVSGCSYTWNNSEQYVCSWPYYLRDICGFEQVFDCSQSGAGSNHIFNSVINEIETNENIKQDNTLVVIMWSGLTRTDVIANQDITAPWHFMSNYNFNNKFATLTIFNGAHGQDLLSSLCQQYKKLVDTDAQIYESMLKIIALESYLKQKQFNFVFTSWMNPQSELDRVKCNLSSQVSSLLNNIPYLDEYANRKKEKEPDGHPTPDAYLGWTREHLIPYLDSKKYIKTL